MFIKIFTNICLEVLVWENFNSKSTRWNVEDNLAFLALSEAISHEPLVVKSNYQDPAIRYVLLIKDKM